MPSVSLLELESATPIYELQTAPHGLVLVGIDGCGGTINSCGRIDQFWSDFLCSFGRFSVNVKRVRYSNFGSNLGGLA
jgi:hypothetical protein